MTDAHVNDPAFWEERYRTGTDGWDLGTPTPAFVDLLDADMLPPGRALVLGTGGGWDAVELARRGFRVTAVDFAAHAVDRTGALAHASGVEVTVLHQDLFTLLPAHLHSFDLVLEYVTYCAVHPGRRGEFARTAAGLLAPGGMLAALFFPLDGREGGPPFAVDMNEVQRLFGAYLTLVALFPPPRSVSPRRGREIMTLWRKETSPQP